MPNLPIRGLGSVGVVTDVDPFNLPINAFTRAKNVRFKEGKISSGPVYRTIASSIPWKPKFTYGLTALTGYDTVLVVDDTMTIREFSNGVFTTVYTGSSQSDSRELTGTMLADVEYINRSVLVVQEPSTTFRTGPSI